MAEGAPKKIGDFLLNIFHKKMDRSLQNKVGSGQDISH